MTSAERGNPMALEMLLKLSLAIKYGKHVVFTRIRLLDRILNLTVLGENVIAQYRRVRNNYVAIGSLVRKIDFKAVVLISGNNCRTRKRILINATTADKLEVYEESHLLTENLQDGEFFEFLVKEYVKTLGSSAPICYMPQMGGGNTIAKVYKMEIDRGQHFCVAILDSDKKFPTASYGETCKALKKEDNDKYLGDPASNGHYAYNCSYYVMNELRELENLIPIGILKTMNNVKNMPLMQMNFDMSYHDMKDGLLAYKIAEGAYQKYLDCLFSFDSKIVDYVDFCADYRKNCCSGREDYEKQCGRWRLVEGLGSKIMEQVMQNAKNELSSNNFSSLSNSQQHEWTMIGKKVFEWCCCLSISPAA